MPAKKVKKLREKHPRVEYLECNACFNLNKETATTCWVCNSILVKSDCKSYKTNDIELRGGVE